MSISADGSSILVGEPFATVGGVSDAGEVFLFDSSGSLQPGWPVSDPTPTSNEEFGRSVSIAADGSSILIGAPGATAGGEAFLFDSSGSLQPGWPVSDPGGFGASVSISADGSSILVGAPGATVGGVLSAGESFLFDSSGSLQPGWPVSDPIPSTGEVFGGTVSISGDGSSILVGAPFATAGGEAFLFDSSGNLQPGWPVSDPTPSPSEEFGLSVSISADGSSILVGAPFVIVGSVENSGEAFLFDSSGSLQPGWPVLDPSPTASEDFGISVSISGDGSSILVGAPGATVGGVFPGESFLFDSSGNLQPGWPVSDPNPRSGEAFGLSVSISVDGGSILVGAPLLPVGGIAAAGEAFLFDPSGNLLVFPPFRD